VYQSFFDLHGGYFDDPALMAEIARLNVLLADAGNRDCSSVAQILVVSDEASCSYATFESSLLQQSLQPAQVQLAKLGAPHDSILVDDLALVDADRYKFVIFLNCYHLTDAQRRLIRQRILNTNRTVLWCYAAGLFNGAGRSVEAMRELTGLHLAITENTDPVRARIRLLERGLQLLGNTATLRQVIGHEHVWGQLVSVDDDTAIPLGALEGREDVVLAMKSMPRWTSVYTLNPVLPAAFLRALAVSSGVHIYNQRDDALYANRSYVTLAADQAGPRRIRLPRDSDVFNPFTGKQLWHGVAQFNHDFSAKETMIWRLH